MEALRQPMTIQDPELRAHVDRIAAIAAGLPKVLRPVCGLMNACDFYSRARGPDSAQVREAVEWLVSEELRPALRSWYQRCGDDMNPAALEFRQRLSELAGERLG